MSIGVEMCCKLPSCIDSKALLVLLVFLDMITLQPIKMDQIHGDRACAPCQNSSIQSTRDPGVIMLATIMHIFPIKYTNRIGVVATVDEHSSCLQPFEKAFTCLEIFGPNASG